MLKREKREQENKSHESIKIDNSPVSQISSQREAELQNTIEKLQSIIQQKTSEYVSEIATKTSEFLKIQQDLQTIVEQQRLELIKQKEEIEKMKIMSTLQQSPHKQVKYHEIEILDSTDIQNLEKIEQIGFGGSGKVTKVSKKQLYALKEMNIQSSSIEKFRYFMNEYEIMNMLDHPNILKTYGFFLSDEKLPPSILLEYCPMNLEKAVKEKILTKVQIVFYIYQIAEGMKYIHSQKVIHRDLKPSNILISKDGMIKICDFGISRLMTAEEQSLTHGIGTQKYMAPEIINEEPYDEKVDVYSFGVLVYFIISGGELPNIKIRDVCLGKSADIPSSFPTLAQQLIEACWIYDTNMRPSFESICDILEQNNFDLISLTKSQADEVSILISKYKSQIPIYSE